MGRFEINEKFIGQPLTPFGEVKSPYADLDEISGCNNADSNLARIGDQTRALQERALAVSAVIPKSLYTYSIKEVVDGLRPGIDERVPDTAGLLFVMDQKGTHLFQSTPHQIHSAEGNIQLVGTCDDAVHGQLAFRRETLLGMSNHHQDVEFSLLDLQPGTVVIETGAGTDFERIARMRDHAASHKSKLVCHDVAPRAARQVADNVEGVPYMALPPHREFLGQALNNVSGPRVITLQNVISSLPFGLIDELMDVGQEMTAERLMITQSLGMADENNMIPSGWRKGDKQRQRDLFVLQSMAKAGVVTGKRPLDVSLSIVVSKQLDHTINLICMEMAIARMKESGAENGFGHNRTLLVSESKLMNTQEARTYLSSYFPDLVSDFEQGTFNTFAVGPFGQEDSVARGVLRGSLHFASDRFIFELSKAQFTTPQIPNVPGQKVSIVPPGQFITPVNCRKVDLRDAWRTLERQLSGDTLLSFEALHRTINIDPFLRFGSELAMDLISGLFSDINPYIKMYGRENEAAFDEEFCRKI